MSSVNVRRLATTDADFEAAFERVRHWSAETDNAIEQRVAEILADVAKVESDAKMEGKSRTMILTPKA